MTDAITQNAIRALLYEAVTNARYVAEAIAKLKNISLEEVANATYANTVRAYGLK